MTTGRWIAGAALLAAAAATCQGLDEPPWERRKREAQDALGGLPEEVLRLQSLERVRVPSLDEAAKAAAGAARKAALPLVDGEYHARGRRLAVPAEFAAIQSAIDAAKAGDTVVVAPGVYFELLVMKDGVRLISEAGEDGDEPVAVEGARLRLPRRALRTVLDGSKSKPSRHGMIDFEPGTGRRTIVDGFTIRNLPAQDHHVPGHAHGLNVRGASPVILNCYIRDNGSTGIGNHVVYRDQGAPMEKRDFRRANVAHEASPVIFHNILRGNLGLGIGCNHFSTPLVLGNVILENDDSALGEEPTPGIGAKHGAAPTIVGNLVHDNPGGGILGRTGDPQGAHPVDGATRPVVRGNLVFGNGGKKPGISCSGGGSKEEPVIFEGNLVLDSGGVGIGLSDGAVGIVEGNVVARAGSAGVAVHGSTALRLNGNLVTGTDAPGFTMVAKSTVLEMKGNGAEATKGPRFVLRDSVVGGPGGRSEPEPGKE